MKHTRATSQAMDLATAQQLGIAPWSDVVQEHEHTVVFADRYPVTAGHLLFVPRINNRQHIGHCFDHALVHGLLLQSQGTCDGFNLGFNWGTAAGQTVMYPHVHLILRQTGDVTDPVGGVRAVIPGQSNYHSDSYKLPPA